jgi:glycosyltransferase involved in cell wall biosynthesis
MAKQSLVHSWEGHVAPDYSIIIPAYNEEELLPATLARVAASMAKVQCLVGEVIVVDNKSTDRTAEVAAGFAAQVVSEEHRQIARARNAGAAAARGRYLIFVDADTRISPALLRRTLAVLESGRCCGGGTMVVFGGKLTLTLRVMAASWHCMSKLWHWAAGSYVFSRRDAFTDIGGFDERFYASEEIHFSRALNKWGRRNGLKMIILDEPAVTSLRKLQWFSWGDLVRLSLRLAVNPWLLCSREGCPLWYERPEAR